MKRKIVIAGGTGLIGKRLIEYLGGDAYEYIILTRGASRSVANLRYSQWNPADHVMEADVLNNCFAVINLAGAGIADKRWTKERKKIILESRVDSAKTIELNLLKLESKPEVYVGASAIGYYGNRGEDLMTEENDSGTGFLAEVTKAWEDSQAPILKLIERAALIRIGIVLSTQGGALKEMLKPAALGSYGYFGNGKAYYSWIHIDDICKLISDILLFDNYKGIYNATAPEPVPIKKLAKALKKAKGGFGLVMPVPEFGLKLALGEMSQMLTDSMRVAPQRLIQQGHQFEYSSLDLALKDILVRNI